METPRETDCVNQRIISLRIKKKCKLAVKYNVTQKYLIHAMKWEKVLEPAEKKVTSFTHQSRHRWQHAGKACYHYHQFKNMSLLGLLYVSIYIKSLKNTIWFVVTYGCETWPLTLKQEQVKNNKTGKCKYSVTFRHVRANPVAEKKQ